ncbi:hypothetical protein ACROYT_G029825 [Oculina patagonica]
MIEAAVLAKIPKAVLLTQHKIVENLKAEGMKGIAEGMAEILSKLHPVQTMAEIHPIIAGGDGVHGALYFNDMSALNAFNERWRDVRDIFATLRLTLLDTDEDIREELLQCNQPFDRGSHPVPYCKKNPQE